MNEKYLQGHALYWQINQVVQEVRITNQTMYMHPAIEQARYQIMEQLFSWQAIVTSQNRIQSTRYQVGWWTALVVEWCFR